MRFFLYVCEEKMSRGFFGMNFDGIIYITLIV